jgi:hypothetical protein
MGEDIVKTIKCTVCERLMTVSPGSRRKYCSRACSVFAQGERYRACRPAHMPPRPSKPKLGRPPSDHWPERTCAACGAAYRGKNKTYCSDACRTVAQKAALPAIAEHVRPLVGKMPYARIAEAIAPVVGECPSVSQIGRAVMFLRAETRVKAKAEADARRPDVPAITESGSWPKETRRGVTLYGVTLPDVTRDEIRLGATAWHGYARGLRIAPEPEKKKRGRKKKAPSALVPPTGPVV